MRVLHLLHKLNLSGIATHLMTQAPGLQQRGCVMAVAARHLNPDKPLGREAYERAGFQTFAAPLGNYLDPRQWSDAHRCITRLHAICEQFQPDVIHLHAGTLMPLAQLIRNRRGIPFITTFHLEQMRRVQMFSARLASRCLRHPFGEAVVAVSQDMKRKLIDELGIRESNIEVIPHGVDAVRFHEPSTEQRQAARTRLGLAQGEPAIAMVAILDPRKNHDLLIEALGQLRRERGLKPVLLCAGSGPEAERERIEATAQRHGVADQVRLLGWHDAREVFWASDIMVLPSLAEAFGLVAVEAMLCGLPVIRTPTAGVSDQIIEGETGYSTPFDDADALANRIAELIANPQQRDAMGRRAAAFARERFTIDTMVSKTHALYQRVARRRQGRAESTLDNPAK